MAETDEDGEAAADRLEAALERIAALAGRSVSEANAPSTEMASPSAHASPVPEIADRLDALIAQLRHALDTPPS